MRQMLQVAEEFAGGQIVLSLEVTTPSDLNPKP
jgi:hypothetical protein